jgi:hypothetical protein
VIALAMIHGRALVAVVVVLLIVCTAAWLLLVGRVWRRDLAEQELTEFEVIGLPERPRVIGDFWWCDWGAIDWPFRVLPRGDEE